MSHEIESIQEGEITCPYCRKEHGDSWELKQDDGEMTCCRCEKRFEYHRIVDVSYLCMPDCILNGTEHRFVPRHGFADQTMNTICAVCGEIPVAKGEK